MEIRIQMGLHYSKEESFFRVYSPQREEMTLRIYENAYTPVGVDYPMEKRYDGIFELVLKGDLEGKCYHYIVDDMAVTDPYSIATSKNSSRSAIVDLHKTDPIGWKDHPIPQTKAQDAIIYELHIKDFTYDRTSGVSPAYGGKYLGLAEKGTSYKDLTTGLDHLKDLGVTHIHLMPIYDFITVKEDEWAFDIDENYNWGYDPELYNVPEGSYATDPEDPYNRIREVKEMVMALHEAGFAVIMDVVYNHTYFGQRSNFEALAPGYYYRMNGSSFSNGSGVGSEFKSEAPMGRKFILDSIEYWMKEYKIDGFRFDLMALTDVETMDLVAQRARKINPNAIIYGEPWAGAQSALDADHMMVKGQQRSMGIGVFNDHFRDSIKGASSDRSQGYINNLPDKKLAVETGIVGSIDFDDLHQSFADEPYESINYVNSHDDLILADKIKKVAGKTDKDHLIDLNKLANSIIFFSFGIVFIHAGNEFMRSKDGINNTYNHPISVNKIDWSYKFEYKEVFDYFVDMIKLRKDLGFFSSYEADDIKDKVSFLPTSNSSLIAFMVEASDKEVYLFFHNPGPAMTFKLEDDYQEKYKIRHIFSKEGMVDRLIDQGQDLPIGSVATEVFELKN